MTLTLQNLPGPVSVFLNGLKIIETQDIPEVIAQSSRVLAQFETIVGRVDGLLAIVENGQGNIGKFIKDDSLYDRLNGTAGAVEQLVKDVKNSNGTISHLLYDDALYINRLRKVVRSSSTLPAPFTTASSG